MKKKINEIERVQIKSDVIAYFLNNEGLIQNQKIVDWINQKIASGDYGKDYSTYMSQIKMRTIINMIRSNAELPICSTQEGYYLSFKQEDIHKTIISLKRRIASIDQAILGLSKMLIRNWTHYDF
jgi:hypothetical protein